MAKKGKNKKKYNEDDAIPDSPDVSSQPEDTAPADTAPEDTAPEDDPLAGLNAEERAAMEEHLKGGGELGKWHEGDRLSKKAWDAMSQESRDLLGLSTWADAQNAMRAYRRRYDPNNPEGDIGRRRQDIFASALQNYGLAGAGNWNDVQNALSSAGLGLDDPLMKQLHMAYLGTGDPSGTFHSTGDGNWLNVATSDLAARPEAMPGWAGGLQNVLSAPILGDLAHSAFNLNKWFDQGRSSMEGRTAEGGFYNVTPGGDYQYVDMFGRPTQGGTAMPNINNTWQQGNQMNSLFAPPSQFGKPSLQSWATQKPKQSFNTGNTWSWR
jgi:hypothetical protein